MHILWLAARFCIQRSFLVVLQSSLQLELNVKLSVNYCYSYSVVGALFGNVALLLQYLA